MAEICGDIRFGRGLAISIYACIKSVSEQQDEQTSDKKLLMAGGCVSNLLFYVGYSSLIVNTGQS